MARKKDGNKVNIHYGGVKNLKNSSFEEKTVSQWKKRLQDYNKNFFFFTEIHEKKKVTI